MPEDIELLRRYAREGSEEAFAELVRQRLGFVYGVALRGVGGDAHLAQDVAQRVFSDLARKAPLLAERSVLAGWLYRSARFEAIDVVRVERRRRRREQVAELMPTSADKPPADWAAIRPDLDQAMSELGETDRDALLLRFFEERAFAEIGRRLRLTEDTARKRVERALDKLRGILARRGVTSSPAVLALLLADKSACAAVPAGLAAVVTGAALGGKLSVGSGLGLGLFSFMNTSKIIAGVSGVMALLAVGFSIREMNMARQASARLEQSVQAEAELRRQLRDTQRRLTEAKARAVATLPPVAAAPTAASPAPKPASVAPLGNSDTGLRPVTQYRNVGRATPQAGLETAVWAAMTTGQEETLADSFVLEGAARTKADELWAKLSYGVRNWAGRPEKLVGLGFARDTVESLESLQVLGIIPTQDADLVTLHLQALPLATDGRQPEAKESKKVQMRRVGSEWKMTVQETMADRSLGRDVEAIVTGRNQRP